MDKNIMHEKLRHLGYSERNANLVADELMVITPELAPHLKAWLADNQLDFSAHNYSIYGLMESRGMNYPAALLTMDWIIKEPEAALHSLKKGVR